MSGHPILEWRIDESARFDPTSAEKVGIDDNDVAGGGECKDRVCVCCA